MKYGLWKEPHEIERYNYPIINYLKQQLSSIAVEVRIITKIYILQPAFNYYYRQPSEISRTLLVIVYQSDEVFYLVRLVIEIWWYLCISSISSANDQIYVIRCICANGPNLTYEHISWISCRDVVKSNGFLSTALLRILIYGKQICKSVVLSMLFCPWSAHMIHQRLHRNVEYLNISGACLPKISKC